MGGGGGGGCGDIHKSSDGDCIHKKKTKKNCIIHNEYKNENVPFWSLRFHNKKKKRTVRQFST